MVSGFSYKAAQISEISHPRNVQPANRLSRNIAVVFLLCLAAATNEGRKYNKRAMISTAARKATDMDLMSENVRNNGSKKD